MKKGISILAISILLCILFPARATETATAATHLYNSSYVPYKSSNANFVIRDGIVEAYYDSYVPDNGNVVIPDGVIEINNYAFFPNGWNPMHNIPLGLDSVVIPNSVKRIGANAFSYSDFFDIDIPDSVVSIGYSAFGNCINLTDPPISNEDRVHVYFLEYGAEALWNKEILTFFDDMAVIKSGSTTWSFQRSFDGRELKQLTGDGCFRVINQNDDNILSNTSENAYNELYYLGYGLFEAVIYDKMESYILHMDDVIHTFYQPMPHQYRASEHTKPSSWALAEVEQAEAAELIIAPKASFVVYFQWNASRQQFCELAINLIEKTLGVDAIPFSDGSSPFTDTNNYAIAAAYQMGLVKGKTADTFDPFANITRQEAAIMLHRLADLLGLQATTDITYFADEAETFTEARQAIRAVSALQNSETGKRVMEGVGNNNFAPGAQYTAEQSIVTMLRLFQIYQEQQ